ncbi:hypothetical protein Tco_0344008 [Tanacetum coccineum]
MIITSADNRPPMLKKSMYDSWKSRMELYIENRENRRMILDSVLNGTLVWPTVVQEDGNTRKKKHAELSATEKIQADCDLKATNIVLLGLPPDVYAIVNHHKFDKFSFVKGETLYQYYWRSAQLINNMNVINMSMRPVQVNTKFLNSLPLEWSKFVTDVKFARELHTTNYDQLYSYLEQHEAHANETRLMHERYQDTLAFVANFNQPPSHITNYHSPYNTIQFPQQTNTMIPQVHSPQTYSPMNAAPHLSLPQISHSSVLPSQQYQSYMDHQTSSIPQNVYHSPQVSTQPMTEFPQLDSGLSAPMFTQGDDPIAYLNKAMAFLLAIAALRVTVQQVQGRQGQSYAGTGYKDNATSSGGNNVGGQARDKAMLAEAQESSQILDEEQQAFLADPGIPDGQAAQTTIPNNAAFQTEDLDSYDSD